MEQAFYMRFEMVFVDDSTIYGLHSVRISKSSFDEIISYTKSIQNIDFYCFVINKAFASNWILDTVDIFHITFIKVIFIGIFLFTFQTVFGITFSICRRRCQLTVDSN